MEALNQAGVHTAYLNGSLTASQYYRALAYGREGRYPINYVAPERLVTEEFLDFARNTKISMVAIDEAHCVSQWGQDFRPSYLKIVEFIERMEVRPVVSAFTVTATKEVRDDISDILMLRADGFSVTRYYAGLSNAEQQKKEAAQENKYLKIFGDREPITELTRELMIERINIFNYKRIQVIFKFADEYKRAVFEKAEFR